MIRVYIDVKNTVWERNVFEVKDQEGVDKIKRVLEEEGAQAIYDEEIGFIETNTLYDTMQEMNPDENSDESTVDMFVGIGDTYGENLVWDNVQKNVV